MNGSGSGSGSGSESERNYYEDRIKELLRAMSRASAELRHTYGHLRLGQHIDPNLVARAIEMLEEAGAKKSEEETK